MISHSKTIKRYFIGSAFLILSMTLIVFATACLNIFQASAAGYIHYNATDFVIQVDTERAGVSGPNEYIIPTSPDFPYNYGVDCDAADPGTNVLSAQTANATCVYAQPGEYYVAISGDFPTMYNYLDTDSLKIIDIAQWGDNAWLSMNSMLANTSLSLLSATDNPDLSQVTDMHSVFNGSAEFNSGISDWDTSNVTDMSYAFYGATSFNNDISGWDTSNVTNMNLMFASATLFNSDISDWDTSSVVSMREMFYNANTFNSDISDWDTSNVVDMSYMFDQASVFNSDISGWDTSNVTNMSRMFYAAETFNSNISAWDTSNVNDMSHMFDQAYSFNSDISGWDTSNVTNMRAMFSHATSFSQNLGTWDLQALSGLLSISNMLDGSGMSIVDYDATLIGWANNPGTPDTLQLGAQGLKYSCQALNARNYLTNDKNWIISGDSLGAVAGCSADGSPILSSPHSGEKMLEAIMSNDIYLILLSTASVLIAVLTGIVVCRISM